MHSINSVFYPPIIAHRGASALAPENTAAAFRKAKALGAKWVELDVTLTKEGEVVVIHDDTLERTTNGVGRVIDHSYPFLKTLDAGSWFGKAFANQRLLSLVETLQLLEQEQLFANIEMKTVVGHEHSLAEQVIQKIQLQHMAPSALLLSSFSKKTLHYVRKLSPTSVLGFLMDEWSTEWKAFCAEINAYSVNLNHDVLSLDRVHALKAEQYRVTAYVVNDPIRAEILFSWGVDAVFSDCPTSMLSYLNVSPSAT